MSRPAAKRIRRTPADLRAEALAAARQLVMNAGEPLTMKAVADAIGVTYPNLSHHFGSAAGLHAAVVEAMVRELLQGLRDVANEVGDEPDACRLVDRVFDVYGRQGLGRVIAWLAQSGDETWMGPVRGLIGDYIAESQARHGDRPDRRIAKIALIVSLTAQAEAQIGRQLGDLLGFSEEERRGVIARLITPLVEHQDY